MGLFTTRLVGLKSKLRILSEPFGYSHPPDQEESLADFVQRKFGAQVLDNLVDPFISTIFLGDASKMGMEGAFPALVEWERRQGSLVRGALRARRSKRDAMESASSSRPFASRADANQGSLHVTDALPTLGSFRSGMGTLPERLAEELKAEASYKVQVASVALFKGKRRGIEARMANLPGRRRANHRAIFGSGGSCLRCCETAREERSSTCRAP